MKELPAVNADGYHVGFTRSYIKGKMRLVANIHATSRKAENTLKFNLAFDFDCLPYIIQDLRTEWSKERESRMQRIASIDKAFPQA